MRHADQFLAVQFSMVDMDAWCTRHQGPRRSCHCRAQNLKHMLPLLDAILIRTILCWELQVRILMYLYLDSSAARGVLSRRGVGRLRHLSCRVLWLQNLVVEKMLQVKAVLGTINRADVSIKRLSIARLESLMFLFGLWSTSQNQLFTAAWIGLLGAYLLWISQCAQVRKGTPNSPSFDSMDGI